MKVNELEPLLVPDIELARLLEVSPRHLWNLDRDGKLGPLPLYLGRSRRWNLQEVREWIAAGAPDRVTWHARDRRLRPR